jgi:hypothetical protein
MSQLFNQSVPLKHQIHAVLTLLGLTLLEIACGLPPSDADLEKKFINHRAEFVELATMFQQDRQILMFRATSVMIPQAGGQGNARAKLINDLNRATDQDWAECSQYGLTRARYNEYKKLFQKLGVTSLGRDNKQIIIAAEPAIEDLYAKGFIYSELHLQPCVSDLDHYDSGDKEQETYKVYKLIAPHWYLFRART